MIKQLLARLLPGKTTFHGGIHITPPGHKIMSTARPSREAALCDEYAISLIQHDGTPFIAQVAIGDRVLRGQLLAAPANHRDAPVHAPTSGTIRAIEPRPDMHPSNRPVPHLILASDGEDQSAPSLPALDIETATPDELRARIHDCGIVGLGGAGFPTARKLGHPANTLVINAAECEPYITCDDLQIRENAAAIIKGAQITARILGADNIHFGIEDDKPEAIAALRAALDTAADPRIRISSVPVRYPSGNARQLFELLLGIRVPADAHASDYGLICHNSGTMKAVYDAVSLGLPLTERYTTISGEGIREPQVLRIRIGTAARELIQQSGGERHEHSAENRHIIGGPMMGYEIASLDTPLQKTGNSLLILPAAPAPEETPCIRCSRCADACPMELLPQQLLWYSQSNQHNRLKQYRLFDCIECGICAAVCPSGIPLVQYYRHSKGDIRAADKKTQDAEHARARHEARTARLEREAAERQAQMDARRAKLREAAATPAPAAPPSPITRQDPNPPEKYTPNRPPSGITTASDDKTAAIEAAKARAAARRAERLAAQTETTEPPPSETTTASDDKTAAIEAAKARAAARRAERLAAQTQTAETPPSETTTASADKTAAIEAAKARAAARKAARLAASDKTTEPTVSEETNPSPASDREATEGGKQTPEAATSTTPPAATENVETLPATFQTLPSGTTTASNDKTAAIEAAKARAAARKAARLAASDKTTEPTVSEETNPSPAREEKWPEAGRGEQTTEPLPSETTTAEPPPFAQPTDPAKSAAIEAAKARAAARKAARLATADNSAQTDAPPEKSPSPYGGRDGMGVEQTDCPSETNTTEPPPFAQATDPAKSAAIEAAKARAAARKAARLAASDKTTEPTVSEETNPSPASGREATEGGAQPPEAATSTTPPAATENVETLPATSQTPPSETTTASADKIAAIEAAKARAAARKAARLAASGNSAEVSASEEKSPSPYGGRNGMGVEQTDCPSEITTPPFAQATDPAKSAAIEAAKARAAARKAARFAVSDKTTEPTVSEEANPSPASGREATEGGTQPPEPATSTIRPTPMENVETLPATSQTPPSETTEGSADKTAAIEAAKARAAARRAERLAVQTQTAETPPSETITGSADKSAAIEAAKARAAARKAARLTASDKTTEPTVSEETNPSPASGREATEGGTQPPEPATSTIRPTATENVETLPATSQTLPSETTTASADKTAAIEAAKARAAARKAARLTNKPNKDKPT